MTLKYLVALGLLALLSMGSYRVMQQNIETENGDAALVNLSGRQRMLSQRIAMFSSRLVHSRSPSDRERIRRQLTDAIALMDKSHYTLLGDDASDPSHRLSPELRTLYFNPPLLLDLQVHNYLKEASALAKAPDAEVNPDNPHLLHILTPASEGLIEALDKAVFQFQAEGERHIDQLKHTEKWVLGSTFIILLVTLFAIFRPMVKRVGEEHQALQLLNETLEQRVVERSNQLAQLRDSFIHNVNHELRTPITCVYAALQTFQEDMIGQLDSTRKEYLDIALRNTKHLNAMIDDLLAVTRAATGKLTIEPRTISLLDLITETIDSLQMIAAGKGIALKAEAPQDLPPAFGDPVRVRQILINLIGNGIKFTPRGGHITVRAHISSKDPTFLSIAVVDTGHGIKPEDVKMLFDRLYQSADSAKTDHQGLGLGLYICRELVTRHHGNIWVESQVGKGSAFFFTLPIWSFEKTL